MSLNPAVQFDETLLTDAEFDPQDKVLPNSPVESNDVNAIALRALRRSARNRETKVAKAGDTMTGALILNAGGTVASGQTLALDGVTLSGNKNLTGNAVFSSITGIVAINNGRKTFNRARVVLADADQTVDVGDGDRFDLVVGPAAPRVITLDHAGTVPNVGETLTFFWFPKSTAVGGGTQYTFQRSDTTVVATFDGAQTIDTGLVWAEFEYQSGGWRLGKNSGTLYDYDAPSNNYYGVVGGAGA